MDRSRPPSGLFPTRPARPAFREPHPVRVGAVLAGAGAAAAWLFVFAMLATSARGFVWLVLGAAVVAWLVALLLAAVGDRGVAVGVALSAGCGVAIAIALVVARWAATGWFLW
ncbi:hypothetical protein [Luedemannella helvata]|uniref:NADH dehydrogenase subunit 6 n=1 Tax=Luedemannella helvata TaxID=349315 RepID=A0ABN2K564_9ACTN